MTARYAEKTTVPVENSRAEIERTLARYGAQSFAYGWDQARAVIEFAHQDRRVRFVLPLPDRGDPEFTEYTRGTTCPTRHRRTAEAAQKEWEQACRQRWRALALAIKAKLEVVEAGISTFEAEFLAQMVLPDNTTFGAWAEPELARVYETATMPTMLALGSGS